MRRVRMLLVALLITSGLMVATPAMVTVAYADTGGGWAANSNPVACNSAHCTYSWGTTETADCSGQTVVPDSGMTMNVQSCILQINGHYEWSHVAVVIITGSPGINGNWPYGNLGATIYGACDPPSAGNCTGYVVGVWRQDETCLYDSLGHLSGKNYCNGPWRTLYDALVQTKIVWQQTDNWNGGTMFSPTVQVID